MTIRRFDGDIDPKFACPRGGFTLVYLKQNFVPAPKSLRWAPSEEQVGLREEHEARWGEYVVSVVFPANNRIYTAEGVIGALMDILGNDTAVIQEVGAETYSKHNVIYVLQEAARHLRDAGPGNRERFGDPCGYYNIPAVTEQFMIRREVSRLFLGRDRTMLDIAEVFDELQDAEKRSLLEEAMSIFVVGRATVS